MIKRSLSVFIVIFLTIWLGEQICSKIHHTRNVTNCLAWFALLGIESVVGFLAYVYVTKD